MGTKRENNMPRVVNIPLKYKIILIITCFSFVLLKNYYDNEFIAKIKNNEEISSVLVCQFTDKTTDTLTHKNTFGKLLNNKQQWELTNLIESLEKGSKKEKKMYEYYGEIEYVMNNQKNIYIEIFFDIDSDFIVLIVYSKGWSGGVNCYIKDNDNLLKKKLIEILQ
ncbi:hypothetical protein [Spirochaeta cellobiosiphila]|uniref:hypothetical protein n=1 Tax=Spirochaeta cellobiosiphila TaxID=504483 RepID=UPI001B7FC5E9|nr:hypothetical protein [Spirochaeta cellobiosiphila]